MSKAATGEDGFALAAALGAALLFALVAYTVLAADRGAIAALDAQLTRARLEAAADAGVATALDGLEAAPGRRWSIQGRAQSLMIDDLQVEVAVEDERGKVSLDASMTPDQARRLFEVASVSGPRLNQLTNGLLNWLDGGRREDGAASPDYVAQGLQPRGAPMHAVGELMAIKGMDSSIYDQVSPALTVFFGYRGVFDRDTASPLALRIVAPDKAEGSNASAVGARPASRPPPAIDLTTSYVGRPFTVRAVARDARGGMFRRVVIVELTGRPERPYWVRAAD